MSRRTTRYRTQGPAKRPGAAPERSRSLSRIGKHWKSKPAIVIKPDGREICNLATREGLAEYKFRILLMWLRQDGRCCNCRRELSLKEATFEHEIPRTRARRDDRVAVVGPYGIFDRHLNGASHKSCNARRGSSGASIWHGNNCVIEREAA